MNDDSKYNLLYKHSKAISASVLFCIVVSVVVCGAFNKLNILMLICIPISIFLAILTTGTVLLYRRDPAYGQRTKFATLTLVGLDFSISSFVAMLLIPEIKDVSAIQKIVTAGGIGIGAIIVAYINFILAKANSDK